MTTREAKRLLEGIEEALDALEIEETQRISTLQDALEDLLEDEDQGEDEDE
jgi:hypothetical protein